MTSMNQSSRINLVRWNVNIAMPRVNLKHLPRFHEKRFNGIIRHDGGYQFISKLFRFIGRQSKNLVDGKPKTWSTAKQTIVRCHAFRPLLELYFLKTISFLLFCYGVIFFPSPSRVCSMCVLSLCSHRLLSFHPTSNAHYSQTHTRGAYRFGLGSCMRKKKFEVRLRKMGTCVLRFPWWSPLVKNTIGNGRTLQ